MRKLKCAADVCLVVLLVIGTLFLLCGRSDAKSVYVGGTMSLTGPYAEDSAAVLAGFEDYVKYVNETKKLAPWRKEQWPKDVTIELLWRDDQLMPAKALSIYEELKAKGICVYRCSGSPIALALKDRMKQDNMGATSMTTGSFLMTPPGTIFTYYPIYTDALAAAADWYKSTWKESRKPRVAYLTSDNSMGKSIEIPQMKAYLEKAGFEFVGIQYIPLIPTSPPTTQLMWLKENKVDLALGVLINANAQPAVKEMVRLGMGPHLAYKMTLAAATPAHMPVFVAAMGELGDGFVVAGGYPPWDDPSPGIKWAAELQKKYRPGKPVNHSQYFGGLVEVMTQVEALRLALQKTPVEKLTPAIVLNDGFYQIKNLDTGGIASSPLSYSSGKIEGVDKVRVDQAKKGKVSKQGVYPVRNIY
ncbi:MAG TPA: ABC transporter substrate-binding protein [Syntrophorhabdaceae bacterium]|nr:ABC transporter substrate-binding protein [Syntrophorhabdaceae bacterium]